MLGTLPGHIVLQSLRIAGEAPHLTNTIVILSDTAKESVVVRAQNPQQQGQMSRWLRDLVVVHPHFGSAAGSLTKFFRDHSVPRQGPKKSAAAAPEPPANAAFASHASRPGSGAASSSFVLLL